MTYQKITIPLDHGNRNMKTVEEVFTSGLAESDLKPGSESTCSTMGNSIPLPESVSPI